MVRDITVQALGRTWTIHQDTDGVFVIPAEIRQFQSWGTALKPAWEPIILAMKPLEGTFAENALKWGVAGLWIDGGRVAVDGTADASQLRTMNRSAKTEANGWGMNQTQSDQPEVVSAKGRFPANLILSWPEDEYELRADVTPEQKRELYGWLSANT